MGIGLGQIGGLGRLGRPRLAGRTGYRFLNAEASDLVARFTTPPTDARKALIDSLVGSLKAAGVWAKLDALYILAAADSQAARQNWIASQFNLTAVSGPTFTADRGYAGNGSSSYLDTNFNPSSGGPYNYVQNAAHFGLYSRTSLTSGLGMMGVNSTNRAQLFGRNASSNASAWINQTLTTTTWTGVVTSSLGFIDLQRIDASTAEMYLASASLGTKAVVSTGVPDASFFIDAMNTGGSPTSFGTYQMAEASMGGLLTAVEVSAKNAAILTYLQAVGAA